MRLNKSDRIVFIGDSVTDAGRKRRCSRDLGNGYPKMVAGMLKALYPELKLTVLNRGISGNKIHNLEERWQKDCINLKPDIVSILIGINDTWHRVGTPSFGDEKALQQFEARYRAILEQTKEQTHAQIVILEPFVLHYPIDRKEWRYDLDLRRTIIEKLADEFAVDYIRLDTLMNEQAHQVGEQTLTGTDGVHPTPAGHRAIAKAWVSMVENN